MKLFGRDPALVLEGVKVLVVLVASFFPVFSGDMQTAAVVLATAVFGLLTALTTRPPQVAAISEFIQTAGVAVAAYGISISPDKLSALVLFSGVVVTLLQRQQISPAEAVPAGSRRASGQADIGYIVKLLLLGLIAVVIIWGIVQVVGSMT